MPEWLLPTLPIVFIITLLFGPTIVAARLERRLVWTFTPLGAPAASVALPPAERFDENPYAVSRAVEDGELKPTLGAISENTAARQAGFRSLGSFRDRRGGTYRTLFDIWLSPEGEVLAMVGGGTILGIPVQNTWLYSLTDDGHCLMTLGDQKGNEIDLGGLVKESMLAGNFDQLLDRHRQRLGRSAAMIVPFSAADPLGDLLAFRRRRFERLEERGLAVFLDPDREAWRYTMKGAFIVAFFGIGRGVRRKFLPDRILDRFRRNSVR